MEKSSNSPIYNRKLGIITLSFIIIFGTGIILALFVYDVPKYPGRTAIIVIDQIGSPIKSLNQLSDGTIWVPDEQYALVPSIQNEMARERGNIYAPDIIYENGLYRMWYGGQSDDGHDSILFATSADGKSWTKYGTVIPTGENNHVNDPSVVKVNGTYYMYYSVAQVREMDEVWMATSLNGINWTVGGAVILPDTNAEQWDSLKVGRPSVLYQAGKFKMWFDGSQRDATDPMKNRVGSGRHVGYATSVNGYNWTKWSENPIVNNSGAIDVDFFDGKYVMVEESGEGILYRTSVNETSFNASSQWLFKKMGTSYDAYGHVTPFIFIKDGQWVATYTGAATVKSWDQNRIAIWYPQLNSTTTTNYNSVSSAVHRPWASSATQSYFKIDTSRGAITYQISLNYNSSSIHYENILSNEKQSYFFDSPTSSLMIIH